MERNINPQYRDINEENYNNLKNVFLFLLIIVIAYLIETTHPNSILRIIYMIIILVIIIGFIKKNLSNDDIDKISTFREKIPFLSSTRNSLEEKKRKLEEKKLKKVKKIYESGYNSSKKKNFTNNNELNFNYNPGKSNKYYNPYDNNRFQNYNDEFLANKISKINKINENYPQLIDSLKYNGNNINRNTNNYNLENNKNREMTVLPPPSSSNSKYNENETINKINNLGTKNIIANPFITHSKKDYSKELSGNDFFLFSTNRNRNKKIISDFSISKNPIENIMGNEKYKDINKNIIDNHINRIPKNKEVSYYKYQYLKIRNENTQKLNQNYNDNNIIKNNINKIPKELENINYNNWNLKMKIFISKTLIPNLIINHDNNISNLNSILSSLGLRMVTTLPENESNDFINTLTEKLSFINSNKINEIKENNLLFKNVKNYVNKNINNISQFNNINDDNNGDRKFLFPSLNNFNNFINDKKEINEKINSENQLKSVFFGDTNKIKQILTLIEKKINTLDLQRNNEQRNNIYYQRKLIIDTINSYNNPFLKKERKTFNDYLKNINDNNNFSLTKLQRLLYERIIINERLFPIELFDKKNETHALLVIEYAIERFRQLQQNFDFYGNGSRGGEFLNDNWCSLLPTDSQLIAHLIVNYIESIYLIKYNKNQQKFLLSYPSNYNISIEENNLKNLNLTSVFLYQINPPDTEPKFNVVCQGVLIPCMLDNHNLFHAFSIYFYLLNLKSPFFVMNLGIHDFINYITK